VSQVEINALNLVFLDIPAEVSEDYNRWYDLDHMPEHVSKADVVMGRRYVAPKHLHGIEGSQPAEQVGGHPPYATIYFFGGPLDFMSDEAMAGWKTMDRGIVKQGRYWQKGRSTGGAKWRLEDAFARPSVLVSKPAIPHLNHRGVIFAIGRAPSVERRQEAVDWWTDIHLPDLFAVPGVMAALRGKPETADPDLVLHVLLCDDPPVEVMPRIEAAKGYASAIGRYPAYGGVYEPQGFLPYDRVVPLEYGFEFAATD
jgi:hypothetical protein